MYDNIRKRKMSISVRPKHEHVPSETPGKSHMHAAELGPIEGLAWILGDGN